MSTAAAAENRGDKEANVDADESVEGVTGLRMWTVVFHAGRVHLFAQE